MKGAQNPSAPGPAGHPVKNLYWLANIFNSHKLSRAAAGPLLNLPIK